MKKWIVLPVLTVAMFTAYQQQLTIANDNVALASKKKMSNSLLKSYAQAFGNRPVDYIQRLPKIYPSQKINDDMYYLYKPGNDKTVLVRVDSPGNYTAVYKYNKKKKNLLGKKLYEGRTIYQKQKPTVIYQ